MERGDWSMLPAVQNCGANGQVYAWAGRWPGWLIVLAVCLAPIVIPLATGAAALFAGLCLCVLALTLGIGVGGVVCIGVGVVASLCGLAGLFAEGVAHGLFYMAAGSAAALLGMVMVAVCAGMAWLDWRAVHWLLRRVKGGA